MREDVSLNGAKRDNLRNPLISAADVHLFCRAVLVGVTFLYAAPVIPAELTEAFRHPAWLTGVKVKAGRQNRDEPLEWQ